MNLLASLIISGTLKKEMELLKTVCFKGPIYLKGERIISSITARIPKYDPILAAMKKKIDTNVIDVKINNQDVRSKSFRRFQVGAVLNGCLENQYRGINRYAGEWTALSA